MDAQGRLARRDRRLLATLAAGGVALGLSAEWFWPAEAHRAAFGTRRPDAGETPPGARDRHVPATPEVDDGFLEQIATREYWATPTPEGLQAPNRRHGLRTWFEPDGVRVHDRTAGGSPRLVELTLSRVGRGGALAAVAAGEVTSHEERVEIRREGMLEWYVNSPEGLEQGFTFDAKPAAQEGGDLMLELAVAGAVASARGDDVVFATAAGRTLGYGALAAYDATGRELAASFEVAALDRVRLVVDDAGALYPVVIDPLLTETADVQLESNQANAYLGQSVASAGDVNGDGYADVIVGAYNYDAGQTDEGAAFIRLGSASGIAPGPAALLEGNQAGAHLGIGVGSAGDVNGDGYDDVIVGAREYDAPESNEGAAFVFLGSAAGIASGNPTTAHAQLESDQVDANLGRSVASAGDVNGDGYADVIVSAHLYDAPLLDEGAVFVFLGSAAGIADGNPTTAHAQLESDQAGAAMGMSIASAGDVNGDGYADVIVGAYSFDGGQTDEGAAYVFLGSASGIADGNPTTAHAEFQANQADALMGRSVAGAGDVNGDGYADVIVGAVHYSAGQTNEGAAFVFLGSASGLADGDPGTAHAQLESNQVDAELGISAASAGDVNGDGYADVMVGAHFYDAGSTDEGTAFVFTGSASGIADGNPATAFAQLEPDQANARMGIDLASAGDVNGDGYADVIVGAHLFNAGQSDEGAAFVYLGGAAGIADGNPATAHASLEGDQLHGHLGTSVASAGDVNGDGYGDVIVGAPKYDAGEADEGAAFLFLGSASGIDGNDPATAHARLEGGEVGAEMGYSVASAGDVNGDGYGDVIVGARFYGLGGGAFVFLGSSAGIASGDATTASRSVVNNLRPDEELGASVASAGDVNGDGFGDMIVGMPKADVGPPGFEWIDAGVAMVFLGQPTGTFIGGAGGIFEGAVHGNFVGSSVASAGDVNGDGYADVIIGIPGANRAVVLLGSPSGIDEGSPTTLLVGGGSDAGSGRSVASAGDVNGDGFADVIIGADRHDGGVVDGGGAFIFHGAPTGIAGGGPHSELVSNQTNAWMGASVASAGDVNGDGYADVIVGARQYDAGQANEGAAFVFLGSPSGIADGNQTTAAAQLESNQAGADLGLSVASAGDVNRDGYADVIVSARLYDAGAIDAGATFVFLGNSEGRPVVARQLRGDGSGIPIPPWGASAQSDRFAAELIASHPAGAGRVRAEIEVCEPGIPFGDGSCTTTLGSWTPIGGGTPEVLLAENVEGLDFGMLHRWRARVQHAPATGPVPENPPHGPWRRVQAQAVEADLRTSLPACQNGIDDDGDTFADYPADPGCTAPSDTTETNPTIQCDDGVDNDGDTFVDYPDDTGCASPTDTIEFNFAPPCSNGIDDDGDTFADYPADPGCASAGDVSEMNAAVACDDGADNDGDTLVDYPDDPGCASPADTVELDDQPQCANGVDDDGNTLVDYPADPGCANAADTVELESAPACSNGSNDDGDAFTDYPADPGCPNAAGWLERPQCQDGIENDADGRIDFDGGQSIHGACSGGSCPPGVSDPNGDGVADPDPHCVGKPFQNREGPTTCGLGAELAFVLAALAWRQRRNGASRRESERGP